MSYDATKHTQFSERVKAIMTAVHQNITREMADLDAIYVQETNSGTDPAFSDTPNATEAEHVSAIIAMRAMITTYEAQISNFTPWIQ